MFHKVLQFSLNNKLLILIFTILLVVWGVYSFMRLPIDAVPDITNNQVQIITTSPTLAPEEVEQLITFPVEIAMANLQNVKEIRSLSRYGLSIITVVFEDHVNTFLARQMVSEQLQLAQGQIPDYLGKPELMPITTGLGEVYQYVLEAKPGFEKVYNITQIRTIQDWIIKRNLAGIRGIVEISSFGGRVQQFEVSIRPERLMQAGVSLDEIFEALRANNLNSGGSYIENGPNAYYLRIKGRVDGPDDIGSIVVKTIRGLPVRLKDLCEINISSPPRYGAMTKDGKGEVVGGITLMLKGANSAEVIRQVKERMMQVEQMLPEGLRVHAYLDRSDLIKKTISTVTTNLVEGGLIVIFVLIILLGNLRAGIIVASVIPLSMLFTLGMMRLFGVSANLMSLGAIDFGLVIDGTVIIVEGILFYLSRHQHAISTQRQMDQAVLHAGNKVVRSASFGVMIILIVYIPILAFSGIEGKTFRPMAQTVAFAISGALLLSFTYVPVVSSLFLNWRKPKHWKFSARLVDFIHQMHQPLLKWAMRNKAASLIMVCLILILSTAQFTRMGGEFIPTLEEGDLAAQMTLMPGSSLKQSTLASSQAEKILLDQFPEVVEVVSKIGTAEVPTDPMAIEDADIMIILKPKKEWVTATTREELVEKMKNALAVMPSAIFEFTQPIQLRFNELMTGSKADVSVKIFGENLDKLDQLAVESAAILKEIDGAGDVKVEQTVGLPQLFISFDRDKLAHHNLTIAHVNQTLEMLYVGSKAGEVLVDDKRFDLVVRLDNESRNQLEKLKTLPIQNSGSPYVALEQVANISFTSGPMQISREQTKRRIGIGINIRNRDVESFVEEASEKLKKNVLLPSGYYFVFGGQFENLQAAKQSASVLVPAALIVIFFLLYFAFHSVTLALLIFTAVPFSTVGSIWALYIREMPFSISAGVGFIALFGVSVLNGIVLINHFENLKKQGFDMKKIVFEGTADRIRPVLMTAAVAALGFFPMAFSTAPGAEVQKPLATVVIGGLITSTMLTLLILPILYSLFSPKRNIAIAPIALAFAGLFVCAPAGSRAQQTISLSQAIQMAQDNNPQIKAANYQYEKQKKIQKASFNLPDPEVKYSYGNINTSRQDYLIEIDQNFQFPTYYRAASRLNKIKTSRAFAQLELTGMLVEYEVSSAYYQWLSHHSIINLLDLKDSLNQKFLESARIQSELGEETPLAAAVASSRLAKIREEKNSERILLNLSYNQLKYLLNTPDSLQPDTSDLLPLAVVFSDTISPSQSPQLRLQKFQMDIEQKKLNLVRNVYAPLLSIGYFNQSIDNQLGFQGWRLGLSLPVWIWHKNAAVRAQKMEMHASEQSYIDHTNAFQTKSDQLYKEVEQLSHTLKHYQEHLLPYTSYIIQFADDQYKAGEISYLEYLLSTGEAFDTEINYLKNLNRYNQTILKIKMLYGL